MVAHIQASVEMNTVQENIEEQNPENGSHICQAVKATQAGQSFRLASEAFDVPAPTIFKHAKKGQKTRREAQESKQKLTPGEEEVLARWVVFCGLIGQPMSKEDVTAKANDILAGKDTVGRHWYRNFFKRKSYLLAFSRSAPLDSKRCAAFNPTVVQTHFQAFEQMIIQFKIPLEHIYNMDEKGIQLGGGRRGSRRRYFFSRRQKNRYRTKSDSLELITVIEAICADGTARIGPGFVAASDDLGEWYDIEGVGCVAVTENGWTNQFIGEKWFTDVFIPQAKKHRISDAPIVLLLDGHNSHLTDGMKTAAYNNSIFLFCLPPKTTHRLQPLDVGIFNLVQSAWVSLCEDQSAQYDPVTRQNVIKHYMSVRNSKFTEQNVKNAWRRSGHAPLNPGVFTDEDYAPSQATSCVTHLPVGYPDHVPSSSESAQDSESEAESSAGTASEEWDIDSDDYLERPIVIYGEGDVSDASYQAESDASEYLTYKVPTTRHIAQTSSIPKKRRANEAEILRAQLEQAEVQLGMVTSQLDAANAHCTLMERANQQLKDQVEASEQARKKTKRSTNPFRDNKIGFLTHPEGKANHERHVAEEEAEARAAAEREREKERQEEAILEARTQLAHNDNYVFPGTVASYKYVKLDSLRDLAASLGVEWKGIKKADLFEAVVEHFEANPELKTHIRYAGLFAQRRGRLD